MTGRAAAALLSLLLLAGCSSAGYLAQAIGGHLDLLRRARPAAEVLADPATPPALRDRLALSQRMRDFAVTELHLPDNRSYRGYADLGRPAAVWNVVAAPELALTLKEWCWPLLPFVGCVGYRGYFDRTAAEALAASLRADGWDVRVYGVPAYSTLGRTDWIGGDPLLNTFIGWSDGELARLIFHELAHQVAYAADDTTFNESFATAVERIGGRRWLDAHPDAAASAEVAASDARRQDFRALVARTRDRLAALYASDLPDAAKRASKAALLAAMRTEHAQIKAERWGGSTAYDAWFAAADNASLAVLSAYDALVPQFERLFEREGGDFSRFYAEVRRLAALPKDERRATLAGLQSADHHDAMPDIHLRRDHTLGLEKARKVAWDWAEQVEKNFEMECTVIEGDSSDTIEFTRSGVNGTLLVAADHFQLDARLGLLLGVFAKKIEGEIEQQLDTLLAAEGGKQRKAKK